MQCHNKNMCIFVHLRLKGGEACDHGENQRFGGGA